MNNNLENEKKEFMDALSLGIDPTGTVPVENLDINTEELKKVVVSTPKEFQSLWGNKISKRSFKEQFISRLVLNQEGIGTVIPQVLSENPMTALIEQFVESRYVLSIDNIIRQDRFVPTILQFRINAPSESAAVNLPLIINSKTLEFRKIYRILGTKRTAERFLIEDKDLFGNEGGAYDLLTGQIYESLQDILDKARKKNGFVIYDDKFSNSSPGELKQLSFTLFGRYYGPNEDIKNPDWDYIFRYLTSGSWEIFKGSVEAGAQIDATKLAKFASRLSLYTPFQVRMMDTPLRSFCIINTKFKQVKIEFNGEKYCFADGEGLFRNIYFNTAVNNELKARGETSYEVKLSATAYSTIQARPYWCCKQTFKGVDDEGIKMALDIYAPRGVKVLKAKDIRRDKSLQELVVRFLSQDERFKDMALIVVYDEDYDGIPDAVTDMNGFKCPGKIWDYAPNYNILTLANIEQEVVRMSIQIMQGLIDMHQKGALAYIKGKGTRLAEEQSDKIFNAVPEYPAFNKFNGKKDDDYDDYDNDDNGEDINWNMITPDVMSEGSKVFSPQYHKKVEQALQSLMRKIRKMNFPETGLNLMIQTDPAVKWLGERVLEQLSNGITEVLVPGYYKETPSMKRLREEDSEEWDQMISSLSPEEARALEEIKPQEHRYEFGISLKEYLDRAKKKVDELIAKNPSKKKELKKKFEILKKEVSLTPPGVIFLPAYKEVNLTLGGSDNDGDHVCLLARWGIIIRHPKAASREYLKIAEWSPFPRPICVNKDVK